jgi:hypothetical protein
MFVKIFHENRPNLENLVFIKINGLARLEKSLLTTGGPSVGRLFLN